MTTRPSYQTVPLLVQQLLSCGMSHAPVQLADFENSPDGLCFCDNKCRFWETYKKSSKFDSGNFLCLYAATLFSTGSCSSRNQFGLLGFLSFKLRILAVEASDVLKFPKRRVNSHGVSIRKIKRNWLSFYIWGTSICGTLSSNKLS